MELKMKNAVPLTTIGSTYNVSTRELFDLVDAMKLELVYLGTIPFVSASDFEFLCTTEDIFNNTLAFNTSVDHDLAA
jgi:hypothetical protein